MSRPPARLWFRGQLPGQTTATSRGAIAIVGARAASRKALDRTRQIALDLARAGHEIVSGGAYGVDAAAHEGALAAGARTFAVLGCGVDIVYPERHQDLFRRIAGQGGLLSELPPGTPPRHRQFPSRNRIVAALCRAVIVVEAARRSGALITARRARELGLPVIAVPGSPGTDALLASGAHADPGPEGVARAIADPAGVDPGITSPCMPDGHPLRPLHDALRLSPQAADGLSRQLGLPLSVVLTQLSQAEIEGWVRRAPGGAYEVTRVQ